MSLAALSFPPHTHPHTLADACLLLRPVLSQLENVLLQNDQCKVCDFGLAHVYEPDPSGPPGSFKTSVMLREVCGSKSYCAPEVLEGKGYAGFPTDVWSCGICLFAMLAGFFPLDEASGSDWRFERVRMAAASNMSATHTIFGFYDRPCTLSREVTDLIDGMLIIPPHQRLTVEQILPDYAVLAMVRKSLASNHAESLLPFFAKNIVTPYFLEHGATISPSSAAPNVATETEVVTQWVAHLSYSTRVLEAAGSSSVCSSLLCARCSRTETL